MKLGFRNYDSVLFLIVALSFSTHIFAEDKTSPEKLIEQLEKGNFDERQDASKQLEALGDSAREALEKAANSSESLDVRETATRLLNGLRNGTLLIEAMDPQGNRLPGIEMVVSLQPGDSGFAPQSREESKPVTVKTNEHGMARLTGLTPGPAQISTEIKGAFISNMGLVPSGICIKTGENRIQYVLEKGGTLAGLVIAADERKPVENARILVVDQNTFNAYHDSDLDVLLGDAANNYIHGSSNAKGEFNISDISAGTYIVYFQHDDFVTRSSEPIQIRAGKSVSLDKAIQLQAKAKVMGTIKTKVLDDAGKPVENSKVLVELVRLVPNENANEQAANKQRLKNVLNQGAHKSLQSLMTDATGAIEFKNQKPGDYRLSVRKEDGNFVVYPKVTVAAGQLTELKGQKPAGPNGISGKVADLSGLSMTEGMDVVALSWDVPDSRLVLADPNSFSNWFANNDDENYGRAKIGGDKGPGTFEIKTLPSGKYSLCFWRIGRDSAPVAFIHGIEVIDGKTTTAPELVIPSTSTLKRKLTIAGKVVGPDGNPIDNVNVALWMGESQNNSRTSNGKFEFDGVELITPSRLIVYLQGFRPCRINLSQPGIDLQNITAVLEKQSFGSLQVTVVDPDDQPLKGATVTPVPSSGAYWDRHNTSPASRARVTGADGKVFLKGLAWGEREIQVKLIGYYLPHPFKTEVHSNAETSVVIKMQRGITLKGHLTLPNGVDPTNLLVNLMQTTDAASANGFAFNQYAPQCYQTSSVDAQGNFKFEGLVPNKSLIAVQYPGLIQAHSGEVNIDEKTSNLDLTLIRATGFKLLCEPDKTSRWVNLFPPNAWDPGSPEYDINGTDTQYIGNMDNSGTFEYFGVKPGKYDLAIGRSSEFSNQPYDEPEASTSSMVIYKQVEIAALADGHPDFERIKALTLPPVDISGKAFGRILIQPKTIGHSSTTEPQGQITLTLAGERCVGTVSLGADKFTRNPEQIKPIVIGTGPVDPTPEVPGRFTLSNLTAGDYRLYWSFDPVDNNRIPDAPGKKNAPEFIRKITVAKNGQVDLGDVTLDLPDSAYTKGDNTEPVWWRYYFGGEIGEDEEPGFQP